MDVPHAHPLSHPPFHHRSAIAKASGLNVDFPPVNGKPVAFAEELRPYLKGISSWYGPTFHGKKTANGEIYNQYGLTAAHPVLPMGTRIMVENLDNGRRVWLRVNDRGPYKKGRILDLSLTAARHLGIYADGTAPVRIEVVSWPDHLDPDMGIRPYFQWVVQVAADYDRRLADEKMAKVLDKAGHIKFWMDHPPATGAFSVVTGPFEQESAARRYASHLKSLGLATLVRNWRK
ncbi:MAG: septal ring lytic transglycosylase RlpA family protein [Deltaproteobacteria bacterium]|nr:septal ring lytic transglycosylase RlpA family protein [Deltaproteobacteria bacterium]